MMLSLDPESVKMPVKKIEQDFNLEIELTKLETLFTDGTAHD